MSATCDVLVLGSGLAGLSLALRVARFAEVLVLTKKEDSESNTNYAQGGIAAGASTTSTSSGPSRNTAP